LLNDPRFASNAERVKNNEALVAALADRLRTQTSAHWLAALEDRGIPAGPVLHYDEVFTNKQILAREMVVETSHPVTGPFRVPGVAVKLSGTPGSVRRAAPRLGEHTREVLTQHQAAQPLPRD
jgi:crotonobetainyl-CoA:carnitine CoA-transferase CaiB-like acyl-CoA transferase